MSLTRIAVFRPVVALTVTLALVLFGVVSYTSLGLEQNPELNLPIVTVQVVYPGASARSVEEQVARRIEDAVAGLGNIKTITSVSRNSLATVTVEFNEGVDVDTAASDVERRVSGVRRDLPTDAEEPSFVKLDLNDVPVLYLSVTSSTGDPVQLYRMADDIVRPRIETVDGVGRVVMVGGRTPEVQVEIDPEKLRAYGLTITDVASAVRGQFLSTSGGDVKTGTGDNTRKVTLSIDSRETDLNALGAMPVTSPDGFSTELRNVAKVYLGGKEAEETVRVNGQPAAGLLVFKQSSANITQTVDKVRPVVEQVGKELPTGFTLGVAVDQSHAVRQTVVGVEEELVLAALITGVVLFFFLHSLRSTIIVMVAIPSSLLVALIVMKVLGLTLNTMTLIGLTTAIGVLVDDSIVVLENIFTHLERGKDPKSAAIDGRSEIGLAAIAITMVDVAVWGPIIFITGITGAFLRSFAIVMVAATLASLLVSFTLTPLFASRWLTTAHEHGLLARIGGFWEPAYRFFEGVYTRVLHWSLRHRPVVMLLAAAVFGINFVVLPRLGTEFVPDINKDTVTVIGELPAGTALEAADRAAKRWELLLLDKERFPEIQTAYVVVGRGDTDFDRESRFISLTLDVGETSSRARTSNQVGQAVSDVGEQIVPGMQARLGGMRAGGQGQPVTVRIFGNDLDTLTGLANTASRTLAARPELADVTNNMSAAPEMTLKPNANRLMDLGLSTQTVGNAVRIAYQGQVVGKWTEASGKERDVRVRLPDSLRYNTEAVSDLPLIRRGQGAGVAVGGTQPGATMLTIRQVATESIENKPIKITRVNRQRVATIGAEPNGVPLGSATRAATEVLNGMALPAGSHWSFAGQGDEQASSFRQLGIGLGLSIVLMYMVLTVLYESWLQPLLILTALPLASVGAFLGLLAFNQTLSVPAFIGLIALFGLVGKNAILLVDRTNDLRRDGMDRISALELAGPHRLRPILMTSAVLILSMIPVALKWGDGGEMRAPLGAVLVGGMATSTFLSLLYVPVAYTYFDSLSTLLGRLSRFELHLPFLGGRPGRGGQGHGERPSRPATRPAGRTSSAPLPVSGGAALASERVAPARGGHRRPRLVVGHGP
ncbi:MAG: efflux RND transporter permease subunit [Chloroflexi bacterium]|nr:efflux RND transporter permease subunit [Chloroflexota bacterium]